ncbi:glucosylceramidase [Rhizomicrobium palustre]|uniref:Glucosylceramidase n=1 Tax=Rhizomicrobium palustre TaxID=189966 RepID=A0A846MZ17_9PROT|nr:glycoside hydrolase family 30 beta sandwich domain-containing protein [Rhizomicrobium palustre]NIK88894.1 glucosylceramidase [Rhizomicrobium palustre]
MRLLRLAAIAALTFLPSITAALAEGGVSVYLTTPDGTKLLSQEPSLSFSQVDKAGITIDASRRYQEIVGFGAAITDASAYLINRMEPSAREALLKELFGRDGGLGFSFTRLTIGASDFSLQHYSYDDVQAGARDPELTHFSIASAKEDVLPVTRAALAVNPSLKIMASPWSAPGWMKSTDSLIKGALLPEAYPSFAAYLNRYADALAAEGVPLYALTIQNEPHFEPGDYPGMRVTPESRAAFVGGYLGPLLSKTHPEIRILDWDHNWDEPQSPLTMLSDAKAARYVAGVAWHCYNGEPSAQGKVHDAHPDKETYFTECSGGGWSPKWSDALPWMAGSLVESVRYWSKGVLFWNLALDENSGPHKGGCGDCRGVVSINSKTGVISRNLEYYVLGHASRFVAQGATRIESGTAPEGISAVAFRNPDASLVLLTVNRSSVNKTLTVTDGVKSFSYALVAGGVATFVWH